MSHFTVLVIGENLEGQLEPYNENTEVERYKKYVDVADLQELVRSVKVRVPDDTGHPDPEDVDAVVRYYHEGAERDEQGWYEWSTYNPNSKWDYWRIGGRWGGTFLLKPGTEGYTEEIAWELTFNDPNNQIPAGRCDQARRGDIDLVRMDAEARIKAVAHWAKLEKAIAGMTLALSWAEVREQIPDIEKAREFYGQQPMVQALRAADLDSFGGDPVADLALGRETYIERQVQKSWAPYAMVRKGEWQAPGRMGWFGMSSEDPEQFAAWCAEVRSVVFNLADDALLTIVDCHI